MLLKAKKDFNFWDNWILIKLKQWEIWECSFDNYNTFKISYSDFIQVFPLIIIVKQEAYFEWVTYAKNDYLEINVINNKQRYIQIKSWYKESFRFIETLKDYQGIQKEYWLDQEAKRVIRTKEQIEKDNKK